MATEQTKVRVTTAGGLVAAVPYLLGFAPAESVVVVGLSGSRSLIGFTLRLDLPEPQLVAAVVDAIAERMATAGLDRVLVFVYTDVAGTLPYWELVQELQAVLKVREAFLVRGGRFFSYTCDDERCCPAEGTVLTGDEDAVGAAFVLRGNGPVGSREEVVAGLAAPTGEIATSFMAALQQAPVAGDEDVQLDRWLESFADPRAELAPEQLVAITRVLEHVAVRDRWLGRLLGDDTDALRSLLEYLLRHVPQGHDAAACTLYGVAAYLQGEGLVATTMFTRALAGDAGYTLARLGLECLDRQLRPSELRQLLAPLVDEEPRT